MDFTVPALPYAKDALAPAMSADTLEFHYEKHHKGYMNKLKAAVEGKPEAEKSLEDIIKSAEGGVFNNAAQVWNHTFFWNSLKPAGGGAPSGGAALDIVNKLGGWEKFRQDWIAAGTGRFGSGWVWLVLSGGEPKIISTPNAETPIAGSDKPLLTTDVWEHAYYLDYKNARNTFMEVVCDKLLNWDFVEQNAKG